jgi:hypothetical protein
MMTLRVSFPWFNRTKYQKDYERDLAKKQAAEQQREDLEQTVREEVHHLTVDVDNARREALLYSDEIAVRAEQALSSRLVEWETGKGMLRDVFEARRMALEAQSMAARAAVVGASPAASAATSAPASDLCMATVRLGEAGGGIALDFQAGAAAKKTSDLYKAGGTWDAAAQATERAGLTAQTWGWVLTVVGSAALAAGLVVSLVTLFSGAPAEETSSLWLSPTPNGVLLTWSFSP